MGKRGQVTVFVILGIVFLFAAALLLYASQLVAQNQLDAQVQASIQDFIELNSLNFYVSSCLDKVATQGLVLLGEQGGVIYEDQNGTFPNPNPTFEGIQYFPYSYGVPNPPNAPDIIVRRLFYGMRDHIDCILYSPPVPIDLRDETTSYYPVRDEYIGNYVSRYSRYTFQNGCIPIGFNYMRQSGFLGANKLLPLCSYNGSNVGGNARHCEPYQYDTPFEPYSIQRQLEEYITKELPNCVDFGAFAQTGNIVTPRLENVTAEVQLLYPRDLRVKASYPFEVFIEGKQPVVEQVDFYTEIDSNLRQFYSFIQELTTKMVRYPTFNLTQDWNNTAVIKNYRPFFHLRFREQPCQTCMRADTQLDDVFTFVDSSTELKGKRYVFNYASMQRRPILDYIHDPGYDFQINVGPILGVLEFDKQYYTNSTMIINPRAVDPNYDSVNYTFMGWRQDYYEYLNWTCCNDPTGKPSIFQPWVNCTLDNHYVCLDRSESYPFERSWMGSQAYQSTKQNASLKANISDLGYHNVTVVVTDEHGDKDFQIVKILVFDLPRAVLEVTNSFTDIYDRVASVEDWYHLDASSSLASIFVGTNDLSRATFIDDYEGFVYEDFDDPLELFLPNDTQYDANNITLGHFTYERLNGYPFRNHNISLIVYQSPGGMDIPSPPVQEQITVAECLPHGYTNPVAGFAPLVNYGTSPLPYPYNSDFETAPHVCCVPIEPPDQIDINNMTGGSYYTGPARCFEQHFFTAYLSRETPYAFLDVAVIEPTDPGILAPAYEHFVAENELDNYYPPDTIENQNNVFNITFMQECSGRRGNACSGAIGISLPSSQILQCNDFDFTGQFARCQGPGVDNGVGNVVSIPRNQAGQALTTGEPACYNYQPGNSFERAMGDTSLTVYTQSPDIWADIQAGYCGEPSNEGLSGPFIDPTAPDKPFTCYPTCDGAGDCVYGELENCFCTANNACQGVSANQFFTNAGNPRFTCESTGTGVRVACDVGCNPQYPSVSAVGCACEDSFDAWIVPPVTAKIDYFFSTTMPLRWTNNDLRSCCTDDNVIYRNGGSITDTEMGFDRRVCYNGQMYTSGDYVGGNINLLSCNGKLAYCSPEAVCEAPPQTYMEDFCIGDSIDCSYYTYTCTAYGWDSS